MVPSLRGVDPECCEQPSAVDRFIYSALEQGALFFLLPPLLAMLVQSRHSVYACTFVGLHFWPRMVYWGVMSGHQSAACCGGCQPAP